MADSILLIGFGGPTSPEQVMPFLENVVRGRNVPRERLEEVVHHYHELGGRSPYNDLAFEQAAALGAALRDSHQLTLPIHVGMRNWHPFLADVVAQLRREGRSHAIGVILAAHRSPSSIQQYQQDVERAIRANQERNPAAAPLIVEYLAPWFEDPGFLEANAARIEESCPYRRGGWPAQVPVLFTAHSIPTRLAAGSPYAADLLASCGGVADILGVSRWRLAFQSRSGDGRTPWLEPDVNDMLRELAAEPVRAPHEVVLQPIGFLQDHVEVLFDLDVEARRTAAEVGLTMYRAGTVGNHPAFIRMLANRTAACALQSSAADH